MLGQISFTKVANVQQYVICTLYRATKMLTFSHVITTRRLSSCYFLKCLMIFWLFTLSLPAMPLFHHYVLLRGWLQRFDYNTMRSRSFELSDNRPSTLVNNTPITCYRQQVTWSLWQSGHAAHRHYVPPDTAMKCRLTYYVAACHFPPTYPCSFSTAIWYTSPFIDGYLVMVTALYYAIFFHMQAFLAILILNTYHNHWNFSLL